MQRADPGRAPCAAEQRAGGKIGAGARGARALILGAILAGGRASRFGSDKAAALVDGRALIDHVRAALTGRVAAIVTVGRDGGIADRPFPGLGPLGGIAGALHYAAGHGFSGVLTVPCDTPRLPPALLDALLRRSPAYCPDTPVIGVWPSTLAADLAARLASREPDRSVRGWAQAIGALPIPAPAPIANINRPEDLLAL